MVIERSKDFYDAYSENCDGIYAAGENLEAVKKDVENAMSRFVNVFSKEFGAVLR